MTRLLREHPAIEVELDIAGALGVIDAGSVDASSISNRAIAMWGRRFCGSLRRQRRSRL